MSTVIARTRRSLAQPTLPFHVLDDEPQSLMAPPPRAAPALPADTLTAWPLLDETSTPVRLEPEPPPAYTGPPRHDFTIADTHDIAVAGTRAKIDANIAAIRLLKQIQADTRLASPDEQRTLARYVGWGATDLARIVGAAEPDDTRDRSARAELQALLPDTEFRGVQASILNAHYSYVDVPRAMWRAVEHLGFRGGRILEPSVGVGHFFGTMPAHLRDTSELHGIEIEPITAGMAQQLYQTAHIQAVGFETAKLAPAYFDLAIGNIPFGSYGVADPAFYASARAPLARAIHNYFFARALDLVRPGGLVVFLSSRYTMDAARDTVRRYLADHADFLGAIRLPCTAFATAGTDVVADIVVLRRRAPHTTPAHHGEWVDTGQHELSPRARPHVRVSFRINKYFLAHPEQVIGTPSADGHQHGHDTYTVTLSDSGAFIPALQAACDALPAVVYEPPASPTVVPTPTMLAPVTAKNGEFHIEGTRVFTTVNGTLEPLVVTGTAKARIQRFIHLRDAYRGVLAAMLERQGPARIAETQASLRRAYDTFVRHHGVVNASANRRALVDDPESARIFALEEIAWVEPRKGAPRKPVVKALADIFTTQTISAPEPPRVARSAPDALVYSLAWRGDVDLPYMARLLGTSELAVVRQLSGTELFRDPITEHWTTRDAFLSGDVVSKLESAEAKALADQEWRPAVDALRAVQPTRIPPDDIDIRLGSAWVPSEIYQAFAAHQLQVSPDDILVRFINTASLSTWTFAATTDVARRRALTHDLNVAERTFFDLMTEAANVGRPEVRKWVGPDSDDTIPDTESTNALRESIRQVDERFRQWWREDTIRAERLADLYNRTFNRIVLRTYDGGHLTLPASNPQIELRPHQRAVIWRILQTGNTLIAHTMGAGKTFALIGAAMERRRLGLARKPLIAVPNHMLDQWRGDILHLYPAAKVLVPSPTDLSSRAARQRFFARIASGDWDVVLLTHSAFERIPVHEATFRQFVDEEIGQLRGYLLETSTDADRKSAKQIERAIKRLENKLVKRSKQSTKDQVLTFEELGIDMLAVDEAHQFKNLFFATKLTRVAGLNQSESDRALDMYLKVRYLNRQTNSRGVVFATGTPICNAVSELFTMMRYLAMEQLETLGIANFDSWKQQFADVVALAEPAPEGGYRERARLRTFTNVGELIMLFRSFADVLTAEDLQLPVPRVHGGRPTLVTTEPPPGFEAFLTQLRDRVALVRTREVEPHVDNMLKITSEAAAAAVDLRLIDPTVPDHPEGRLTKAAEHIASVYHAYDGQQGTQLVFLDIGIPRSHELPPLNLDDIPLILESDIDDGAPAEVPDDETATIATQETFIGRNLYEDLRQKLIRRDVHPTHIAFIHQAHTDHDKLRLYQAVNSGRIRILIASSSKGGVGMNVQRRLVALHHLDVPWRPADLEQREGRILRQGNIFYEQNPLTFTVKIFRYVTLRSFDAFRWGLLSVKQAFISQLLRGKLGVRTFDDVDTSQLSFDEAAAAASGDPRTIELLDTRQRLARLEAQHALHVKRTSSAKSMLMHYRTAARASDAVATRLPVFAAAWEAWDRCVTVGTRHFSIDDTAARAALKDALLAAAERVTATAANWQRVAGTVGLVGSLYDITLSLSTPTQDGNTGAWQREATLVLAPQPEWTDVTDVLSYATPSWMTTGDDNRPPDVVRSFDSRWKTNDWITRLADQYTQRAREAADAHAREKELATRVFAAQAQLDDTRRRVRELEQALQAEAVSATADPGSIPVPP